MTRRIVKSFLFSLLGVLLRIALISDFFILPSLAASTILFDYTFEPLPYAPIIQPEISPHNVIVRFSQHSLVIQDQDTFGAQIRVTDTDDDGTGATNPFFRVPVPEGKTPEEFLEELRDDPRVLSAEPDIVRRITVTPNDPNVASQWHLVDTLAGIQAPTAWDIQTGSRDVVVAVIDTGVDLDHPDLAKNIWVNPGEIAGNALDDDKNGFVDDVHGYDFFSDNGNPTPSPDGIDNDDFGGADTGVTHGTHVAGIIGAVGNNDVGVSGVVWGVSIMALQVLDDEGAGLDSSIATGIQYAADNGADIINMSLGGFGSTDVLEQAIQYAQRKGVLVVAASGNNGVSITQNPFYPVCYDGVLGVASTGQNNESSVFSNYGSECVDVSAPGDSILATFFTNDAKHNFVDDYGVLSGTSMAAPVVAGITALVKAEDPSLSRQSLAETVMFNTADVKLSTAFGIGRVDATQALKRVHVIGSPIAPAAIHAFNSPAKKKEYKKKQRSADRTPYFTWEQAEDSDGIAGYYVYFGGDPNANPATAGVFQTERSFQAHDVRGNERSFYLRIVAKDTTGALSLDTKTFEYVVDTGIAAPQLSLARSGNVDDGIAVQWRRVHGEHVAAYVIRRAIKEGDIFRNDKKIAAAPRTAYRIIDHSAQRGATYRYRVFAVDDLGNKRHDRRMNMHITCIPQERLVVGAGAGAEPLVRIINAMNATVEQSWLAFDRSEKFGVEVAVGNLSQRAQDEIVVALASGAEPRVKVLQSDGTLRASFLAYESSFRGGVHVAVGDVDADGRDEIITAPGRGRQPEVKIFHDNGTLMSSFLALDEKFQGGLMVTAANLDDDRDDDIIVSAGPAGGPQVVVYTDALGTVGANVFAYDTSMTNGVSVSQFHSSKNAAEEIVTLPLAGQGVLKRFGKVDGSLKQLTIGFIASAAGRVSAGDVFQKGTDRLLIGGVRDGRALVFIYDKNGGLLGQLHPFNDNILGSIAAGWVY